MICRTGTLGGPTGPLLPCCHCHVPSIQARISALVCKAAWCPLPWEAQPQATRHGFLLHRELQAARPRDGYTCILHCSSGRNNLCVHATSPGPERCRALAHASGSFFLACTCQPAPKPRLQQSRLINQGIKRRHIPDHANATETKCRPRRLPALAAAVPFVPPEIPGHGLVPCG